MISFFTFYHLSIGAGSNDIDNDGLSDDVDFCMADPNGGAFTDVCACDLNEDGVVSFSDATTFLGIIGSGPLPADLAYSHIDRVAPKGIIDSKDYQNWVNQCLN